MSKRIEELIEVIEEIRENFQLQTGARNIRRIRISAVKSVADRRGIEAGTVRDTFGRGLEPDIKCTNDFDKFLYSWLDDGSDELKEILLNHIPKRIRMDLDRELINKTFNKILESDISLPQEFEYDPNDEYFKEGQLKIHLRVEKERNSDLINNAKGKWNREQDGRIRCSICSFSFSETYGKVGEGFIEAHHTQPISSLAPDTNVSPADLVPVCSNCHSMLHRHRPWLTVEQLCTIFRLTV